MFQIFVDIFQVGFKLLEADDVGLMLLEPGCEPFVVR